MPQLTADWMRESIVTKYDDPREGNMALYRFIKEGLAKKDFTNADVEIADVALATGALNPYRMQESVNAVNRYARETEHTGGGEQMIQEAAAASVTTAGFQAITGDLLTNQILDGYNTDGGYIGDQLVTVERTTFRNQRMASLKGMGGLLEVGENQPYLETGLGEKWIQTKEAKYGRMLSISMETLMFDRSGSIRRAMNLFGVRAREKKEELIVKGVTDQNTDVWRPSGVPTALYAVANQNLIGTGAAPAGWTSAIPLADWEDIDSVLHYRATQIVDDRVDGTPQPIIGLNGSQNVLLIPWALHLQAHYALGWTNQQRGSDTNPGRFDYNSNPVRGFVKDVLKSTFLDAVATTGDTTWYYGDFKRQFVYTELLPEAIFTQGDNSDAAFERDTNLRVKVRFYGGVSALDTIYVTKVLGE